MFLKYHVGSLFIFFEKVFAICKVFTARCLDARFWDLFYFIVWCSVHSIGIFFFAERKCVDLVVIFNEGWNFWGIFTKSQKLCLHKIFNIGSTSKVNCRKFYFLIFYVIIYILCKLITAKKLSISKCFEQIKLWFC